MMTTSQRMKTLFTALTCSVLFASIAFAQETLDLNTATREQLEQLPGVGAKIASDIVREREENGPFSSADDLARVPSVTPSVTSLRGGPRECRPWSQPTATSPNTIIRKPGTPTASSSDPKT